MASSAAVSQPARASPSPSASSSGSSSSSVRLACIANVASAKQTLPTCTHLKTKTRTIPTPSTSPTGSIPAPVAVGEEGGSRARSTRRPSIRRRRSKGRTEGTGTDTTRTRASPPLLGPRRTTPATTQGERLARRDRRRSTTRRRLACRGSRRTARRAREEALETVHGLVCDSSPLHSTFCIRVFVLNWWAPRELCLERDGLPVAPGTVLGTAGHPIILSYQITGYNWSATAMSAPAAGQQSTVTTPFNRHLFTRTFGLSVR
ncbi:hypothetical protein HETIRDRAFT_441949, partial [Heterobasidion irregulare TC 32-1]